jgi:hypothetical protein
MRRLYEWRLQRGCAEPLVLVIKRPSDLVRGRLQSYMAIGYGVGRLEEVGGPDAGTGGRDVIDSTGAGDALAAGYLLGIINRRPPNECSNLAFVMALSASSQFGCTRWPSPQRRVGKGMASVSARTTCTALVGHARTRLEASCVAMHDYFANLFRVRSVR